MLLPSLVHFALLGVAISVEAYVNLFDTLNAGASLQGLETLAKSASSFNATAFDVGNLLTHMPYGRIWQGPEQRMWWIVTRDCLPYLKKLDSILVKCAKPVPLNALSALWDERRKTWDSETDEYLEIEDFVSTLNNTIRRTDGFYDAMDKDLQYQIISFLTDHPDNTQSSTSGSYELCADHVGENADWTIKNLVALLGPECASSSDSDIGAFVGCLHRFYVRLFKYERSALENLVDAVKSYLLKSLNIYGICQPMVGAANVYESTQRAITAIQTVNRALQKGYAEGFFDDAEDEHVIETVLSAEEKLSYPQSDTSNSTYARIGGSVLANLTYWFPRFHYHAAIYYAPDGQENHCTVNLTNNLRANGQLDYNVRYTVTRTPINDTLVLEDARIG